jgi:hypothetical protein
MFLSLNILAILLGLAGPLGSERGFVGAKSYRKIEDKPALTDSSLTRCDDGYSIPEFIIVDYLKLGWGVDVQAECG